MEGSVATYSFLSLGLFSLKTNCLGLWRLRSWENSFSMMRAAVSRTVQTRFPTCINQQEKQVCLLEGMGSIRVPFVALSAFKA